MQAPTRESGPHETLLTALVLSRGVARAAYQVGVLRALVRMRRATAGEVHVQAVGGGFGRCAIPTSDYVVKPAALPRRPVPPA